VFSVLAASKGAVVLGGLGVTAAVLGLVDVWFGRSWLLASGWGIGIAAGSIVGVLCLLAAIRRRPRVEIRPDGFVVLTLLGSRSRRWSDIEGDFLVIKVPFKIVAYRLTQAFKESAGIKPTTLFAGKEEGISGAFGVSVGELAELLNRHKKLRAAAVSACVAEPADGPERR
jgi:hypothetical protein